MPLLSFLSRHRHARRKERAQQLARNDHERGHETRLMIALKRQDSVNSLTAADPAETSRQRRRRHRERVATAGISRSFSPRSGGW